MKLADIIEGMQIIAKHAGNDQYCVQAEHDEIYCGSTTWPFTEAERQRLKELGWAADSGETWHCFT